MNYERIINSEGYRFEDLTPENKTIITNLRYLEEDLGHAGIVEDLYGMDDSVIGKIKTEIGKEVMAAVLKNIHYLISAYQISMIEDQPYEVE